MENEYLTGDDFMNDDFEIVFIPKKTVELYEYNNEIVEGQMEDGSLTLVAPLGVDKKYRYKPWDRDDMACVFVPVRNILFRRESLVAEISTDGEL